MSFAEKLRNSRSELVYLVRGKDRGMACWHYVLVDKPKLPIFLEKVKSGSLDVALYGKVLESGWGQDPAPEIEQKIKEQFGG